MTDTPIEIVSAYAGHALRDVAKAMPLGDFMQWRDTVLLKFDRIALKEALRRHDYNVARTARTLKLHRQSLQKMLTRIGIKASDVRKEDLRAEASKK